MELPESVIETVVRRGQILLSDIFEEIDHSKFFVIIGIADDEVAGFFYINSDINRFINNKPEQLLMQYPLFSKDYSFLSHDSYVNATNIIKFTKSDIVKSIVDKRTKIIDELHVEHLNELLDRVRKSKLFSKIDKRRFFSL